MLPLRVTPNRYSTEMGVYTPGCGLERLMFAWGHDEYMYVSDCLPCVRPNVIR